MADEKRIDWLEGDTGSIAFTLKDENGDPVLKAALDSLTLDLYHLAADGTMTTINDREAQDVLDANNVSMHATTGVVTWDVQRDDVPFLGEDDDTAQVETHVATFRASWDATESKAFSIVMRVKNLRRFAVE